MKLYIVGIGPGDPKHLTVQASEHLKKSPCIIGAVRQVESIRPLIASTSEILTYSGSLQALKEHIESKQTAYPYLSILASGDPNFYGIAPFIKKTFSDCEIEILWGMSSVQYLFMKLNLPMHDVFLTSAHGRHFNEDMLRQHKRIGILTDRIWTPYALAQTLLKMNLNPLMGIGENLSYKSEKIVLCKASEVENRDYDLNVVVIDYER